MKLSKPEIKTPENILAAKAEQVLLERLPVDQKTMQRVVKLLEPKNLMRIGIAAVGGSALISIVSSISHDRIYQAVVAKEIKKQITPLQQKLDELQAQNAVLMQQNAELAAQLNRLEKKG